MKAHSDVSEERIREVLREFQGDIYQRPPIRASVKRRVRVRRIYYLELLEVDGRNVLFKVGCEAGTYVRKLVHDFGEALGCGAHMHELRRTRAGPFTEDENLVTLYDVLYLFSRWKETGDEGFLRKFILPMEKGLDMLPKIHIRDSAVDAVCHGAHLAAPGVTFLETGISPGEIVAVLSLKGEAVALVKVVVDTDEMLKMDHGIVARTIRVLMPQGTYPKLWRSGSPLLR